MQGGFDIRNELLSEIEALEKNYKVVKDILSGATYDLSDTKGTLQSLKDNLSTVNYLLMSLFYVRGYKVEQLPIASILKQIDFALSMLALNPQLNPSDVIQISLALSNEKIESVMSLVSLLKKTI